MAVYTEIDEKTLSEFLSHYAVGQAVSFKGIAEGVENSNYFLQTTESLFILTVYEKRVNPDDLPYFLKLMQHLAQKGLPSPLPVANRQSELLTPVKGRPAALITFLQGVWQKTPTEAHIYQVGVMLAKMHQATLDFPHHRPNTLTLKNWVELYNTIENGIEGAFQGLKSVLNTELEFLQKNWPQEKDLPYGTIHADLFPDNVLFLENTLTGLIDFYFACTDFLVYDLAICLNAWCFDEKNNEIICNIQKAQALLQGYQSVRPLTSSEQQNLPVILRGATMRFLLTRTHDWIFHDPRAFVTPKNPQEYILKLKFHQNNPDFSLNILKTV